jgi:aryl-alcohol dehydrogenase-like predicted oxidoreductase
MDLNDDLMETRLLGRTGLTVSSVGLGAWQLGTGIVENPAWAGGPGADMSYAMVQAALDRGVTFFDTAPGYASGRSEELLGAALEGRRAEVVLCSKFGHTAEGRTDWKASSIEAAVEQSLTRLQTDYLDVVLLHSPPPELLDGSSPHYAELARLQASGMIHWYGASIDFGASVDQLVSTTDSQVLEIWFNALHQEPLPALERAAAKGLGVIVKVPLDSGWLAGRYRADSVFSDVRSRWTPEQIARRADLARRFGELLPDGLSMTHGALAFILSQPFVSTVIPGAKSVDQLRDNVAAADVQLSPETVDAIRRLWEDEIRDAQLPW